MTSRRFPAPWRADKIPGGYVVRDANGRSLVYVCSRDNDAEALQAKVLTKEQSAPHRRQRGTPAAVPRQGGLKAYPLV
jgi:hypothetical protein